MSQEAPTTPAAPRKRPQCKLHPSNESVGFCTACGAPFCPACRTNVLGRAVCTDCFESEKLRRKVHEEETRRFRQKFRRTAIRARWYLVGPQGYLVRAFLWVRGTNFLPLMRLAAFGVNAFVMLSLTVFTLIGGDVFLGQQAGKGENWFLYWRPFAPMGVALLYFTLAWGVFGTDLGKWPMGLVVRQAGGKRLGLWRAFWRAVALLGMMVWMAFGVVALLWTKWLVDLTGQYVGLKGVLFFWVLAGLGSLFTWLFLLLMFLGRQKRHLADFLGQSVVMHRPQKPAPETDREASPPAPASSTTQPPTPAATA